MTTELKETLADYAAGNHRVMMNLADELLALALALKRNLAKFDEKLFFDAFAPRPRAAKAGGRRR